MVQGLGRALGWQGAQGSPVFRCDGSMAPPQHLLLGGEAPVAEAPW